MYAIHIGSKCGISRACLCHAGNVDVKSNGAAPAGNRELPEYSPGAGQIGIVSCWVCYHFQYPCLCRRPGRVTLQNTVVFSLIMELHFCYRWDNVK